MRVHLIQTDAAEAARVAQALGERGHEVVAAKAGPDGDPEVCLVCLAPRGARALVALAKALEAPHLRGLPLLFAGGDESALLAAGEAYPRASFVRFDQVFTALASLTH